MMNRPAAPPSRPPLSAELGWFIRLRWLAAAAVLVAGALHFGVIDWFPPALRLLVAGAAITLYNAALWWVLRRGTRRLGPRTWLLALAWAQVILDLGCLTLLALWTGGIASPLLGLFALHMVFASILLPMPMAFGGAALAVAMLATGLWSAGHWPDARPERLSALGWAASLMLTVYVTSHITRALRRHRRRLARQNRRIRLQNRRIRALARQLRRQQRAMVQHEKMVAMGQMAAGVAHEIANPLASMDTLLQLMLRKPERLTADGARTLREQVARISRIVQQMTTFAHPADTPGQVLPLNDVVERGLEMIAFDRRLRGVKLERVFSPDVGAVPLEPQSLQQVLINLVSNALDAMTDAPDPRLTVRTFRHGGDYVIEVSDTGHGIPPEHLTRLFEPFFTTKPVGKGTGLGLSISYSLVRKMGGEITAQSRPGQGATFTIRLPIHAPQADPAATAPTNGS